MDLLAQIATHGGPSDVDELRVYADELTLRGDPFGELIVIASERLTRDTPELRRREEALIADHTHRLHVLLDRGLQQTFRWRRGFVDAVELSWAAGTPVPGLAKLAEEPVMRLVRRLSWDVTPGVGDTAPIFAELARLAPRFPWLVGIAVRATRERGDPRIAGPIAVDDARSGVIQVRDVTRLYAAFPKLEALELDGNDPELGDLVLPAARRFAVTGLALDDIRRIVAARMPVLADLELAFRVSAVPNIAATFGPLLHREFAQLEALSLTPPSAALSWVVAELPTCPLARHVKHLAFRQLIFGEDVARMLIADARAWKRLDRLELRARNLSATMLKQLRRTFGGALALV